jgi:hypothetical protein
MTFEEALTNLINCYSIENESNTPDYVLAAYIRNCLNSIKVFTNARDSYYGIKTNGIDAMHINQEIITNQVVVEKTV